MIAGDSLAILRAELKNQKKHVKSLKKKSLWSRILEEVMEKLVDIVHFLNLEIHTAFGSSGISKSQEFDTSKMRLCKHHRLSKSSSHSPASETKKDPFPIRRPSSVPIIDFDINWIKALDVMDRVDTI
ncbi:unnamed protein product [Fraxinus pennsylvanica]|uniref:Uncharacterized protein n=1 Tax=Fraxinus pennsylvanica TaxID=56036 RepID=A0AAD2E864_9LAMI|nr:unnamed protein product [Fraxinus pennsylvanica]